jgi:hypothetical protein
MPLLNTARLDTLITQSLSFIRTRFPGKATGNANFLGKVARAWAMGLFSIQRSIEAVDRDSPPSSKSSTLALDTWAFTIGVPKNTGGFGRNDATAATGGLAPVTGVATTVVLAGSTLTAPDGVTVIELVANVIIPATGSFIAQTTGTGGNLPTGTVLTWDSPPAGCDPTVTLSSPLSGAEDVEDNAALLQRILDREQQPPKGGANIDYKGWAEGVDGVFIAYVYPRRAGTGSVDIVITAAGSGAGRIPSATVQANVLAYVDSQKPTDVEQVRVLLPVQPSAKDLSVKVGAILRPAYSWDWDDVGLTFTVAGYSAGTPSVTLNTAAPQSLLDAVDLGNKPRIQVVNSNVAAPVIAETARVIAYDGTHTILTLEDPLSSTPTNGDRVYAGSYAAPLIAQGILDYVDTIGPSKLSGLADPVNFWSDVVSLLGIADAAIDTFDVDGTTKLIDHIPAGALTIAVGAGVPSGNDFQSVDPLLTAPEMARASHVIVYQEVSA